MVKAIRNIYLYISVCSLLSVTSCINTKQATYFNNQQDTNLAAAVKIPQTIVQSNDVLGISVSSLNPAASQIFNSPVLTYANTSNNTGGTLQSSGYLVGTSGKIQFPVLGEITVSGLSTDKITKLITDSLLSRKLLVDPIVSVRIVNFKVTVLGEVAHPTVVNVVSEKISLLEALGLAGDVTVYGKKSNIMLIREENGNRKVKRLDLNSSELLTSPYYYLKSNDIVYVESNKAKVAGSSRANQLLPILLSGLSFAAIIIDRLTR